MDDEEQLGIFYDNTGRIGPVVIDVGWDHRYIVATRRTPGRPGGERFYYYLEIAKDTPASSYGAVTGPLTEGEFETAKAALGLPDFSLHYPELR